MRSCSCPHTFPVCACFEGDTGRPLLDRSRWLSSLAGWPGPVAQVEADQVVATYGRHRRPLMLSLPRIEPAIDDPAAPSGCGCGRA